MGQIYDKLLDDAAHGPVARREVSGDPVRTHLGRRPQQASAKGITSTTRSFYGSLTEYSRKIAYFFHASLQGTACNPGVADALEYMHACGVKQGLIADGQCFTLLQLQRALEQQHCPTPLNQLIDPEMCALSFALRRTQAVGTAFRTVLQAAARPRASRPCRSCTSARASCTTWPPPRGWACAPACSPATRSRCRPPRAGQGPGHAPRCAADRVRADQGVYSRWIVGRQKIYPIVFSVSLCLCG